MKMNALHIRRTLTLVLIASLGLVSAGFDKGCSKPKKDDAVAYAQDVLDSFQAALPIIRTLRPKLASKWERGIDQASKLMAAVAASDAASIAGLVYDLVPLFDEAVRDFDGDANAMLALALGNIGLHFFVNHFIAKPAPAKQAKKGTIPMMKREAVDPVERFRGEPVWGCKYRPDFDKRCNGLPNLQSEPR